MAQIGINQFCFPMRYDVQDAIIASKKLGFDCIEVCFTAGDEIVRNNGVSDVLDINNYHNRLLNVMSTNNEIKELKRIADDNALRISSVGGIISFSIYPLSSNDVQVARKSKDAVKRMIEAAMLLGTDTVLVIPGALSSDQRYEWAYEAAQSRISELADYMPGVNLAIENVWNGMLYTPLELSRFVDEINRKNVGVYFDIANARRFGWPEQWIRSLGQRIMKVHCKDYRVSIDNIHGFTNILDGDVNYPEVINALREIGYDGDMIIELIPPATYLVETTLEYAKNTLERLLKGEERA